MCLWIEISIDKNAIFHMFFDRFRDEFTFTIIALHHALISVPCHGHFVEFFDLIIGPLLFGIEKLDFLWSKLRCLSAIFRIGTSHKLIVIESFQTLRVMNFEAFGTELSTA